MFDTENHFPTEIRTSADAELCDAIIDQARKLQRERSTELAATYMASMDVPLKVALGVLARPRSQSLAAR